MSKNLIKKLSDALDSGQLFDIVDQSLAHRQVLAKLGFAGKGQYAQIVREFLLEQDVDTSHFTVNGKQKATIITKQCLCCGIDFNVEDRPSATKVTCSRACSNTYFRSGINNGNFKDSPKNYRSKALKHFDNVCIRCGYDNVLALEVHHKDKDILNNDLSNLEILCANCHTIEHKTKA